MLRLLLLRLLVSDADDLDLQSATVRFTSGYASGEDLLEFTNQNGITGLWDSGTGTLMLSGTSSVANYQTALRSVTYRNTSQSPDETLRVIEFEVYDGQALSADSRSLSVTAVNDRPTLSGIDGDTLAHEAGTGAEVIEQGFDVVFF